MEKTMEFISPKEWFDEQTKKDAIEKKLEHQTTHINLEKKPLVNEYNFYNELTSERERIWFKLFKLQYYQVTDKQFKGAKVAWSTIYYFQCYIRTITNGKKSVETFCKNMLPVYTFVNKLKELNIQPFPRYAKQVNSRHLELKVLLNSGKINQQERDFINSPISKTEDAHARCGFNKSYQQIVIDNYKKPIKEWRHLVPKYSDFTVKRYVTYCNRLEKGDFSSTYLNESLANLFKATYNVKPIKTANKTIPNKKVDIIPQVENTYKYGIMKDNELVVTSDNEQFIEGYIMALKQLNIDLSAYKSIKITQLN